MGIKKCIKIVFVIFSVIILSSVFIIGENKIKLTCNQSGDFTILVVSDPQCDTEGQWQEYGRAFYAQPSGHSEER